MLAQSCADSLMSFSALAGEPASWLQSSNASLSARPCRSHFFRIRGAPSRRRLPTAAWRGDAISKERHVLPRPRVRTPSGSACKEESWSRTMSNRSCWTAKKVGGMPRNQGPPTTPRSPRGPWSLSCRPSSRPQACSRSPRPL